MTNSASQIYEFGPFRLDAGRRSLLRDGELVPLTAKTFELLLVLVENYGRVVGKEELLQKVWPDTVVEENNLSVNMSMLRKALGDNPHEHRYVVTIPGRGYRFAAEVRELERDEAESVKNYSVASGIGPQAASHESSGERSIPGAGSAPAGRVRRDWRLWALTAIALLASAAVAFSYLRPSPILSDKDTVLLADFQNKTGDPVFDGTLKQALAVQLEQSPFLNIFPDARARETLRYMGRPPETLVSGAIAHEISQRQGLKAVIAGEVASLGRHYVITLEATNGQTGDTLARAQVEAEDKEQVLRRLSEAASKLRRELGESLNSIQQYDVPIEQATTPSLEALKAYSFGVDEHRRGRSLQAIPFLKRAVELDPQFALAHSRLAWAYRESGYRELAAEPARRAFELREHVTDRENYLIAESYYWHVTGEFDKAMEVLELWKRTYPRNWEPTNDLAYLSNLMGQYEKAAELAREAIPVNPGVAYPYVNLAWALMSLNRYEEAREILERALEREPDYRAYHDRLYVIAAIRGETAAMEQHARWAKENQNGHMILGLEAEAAAFAGRLRLARELSHQAIGMTERDAMKERATDFATRAAQREALFGNCEQVKESTADALALAFCGKLSLAESLLNAEVKRRPKDTLLNAVWRPVTLSAIELRGDDPARALTSIQSVGGSERAAGFWPAYLRGHSYLRLGAGREAAAEFRRILDHRGWSPLSPLYPLAHLGLARAYSLAGEFAQSRRTYEDLFSLWKDADPDLPILHEARREYERLPGGRDK